jgi:hypothetical protein
MFDVVFFRLLLCVFVGCVAADFMGIFGVIFAAPIFGLLLARPLIDILASSSRAAKDYVYGELQGRFFAFRDIAIDILVDDGDRWIKLSDVRKVILGLPSDAFFAQQYPEGCPLPHNNSDLRIEARSLLHYLQRCTTQDSNKFKLWLQRQVVFPADQIRARG